MYQQESHIDNLQYFRNGKKSLNHYVEIDLNMRFAFLSVCSENQQKFNRNRAFCSIFGETIA